MKIPKSDRITDEIHPTFHSDRGEQNLSWKKLVIFLERFLTNPLCVLIVFERKVRRIYVKNVFEKFIFAQTNNFHFLEGNNFASLNLEVIKLWQAPVAWGQNGPKRGQHKWVGFEILHKILPRHSLLLDEVIIYFTLV